MASFVKCKSACRMWTTLLICHVAVFCSVGLLVSTPCCESKPSEMNDNAEFVFDYPRASETTNPPAAVGDPMSQDVSWNHCIEIAKPMERVEWAKMHGAWFADSTSDPTDGITCAMTRFDKLPSQLSNGIVVTKLFTLEGSENSIEHDVGSDSDAASDKPGSVETLEPAIGWLDPVAVNTSSSSNTTTHGNSTSYAGSMTLIHALRDEQLRQASAEQNEGAVGGLLLRIYLIDTDYTNYAIFHTCAIHSESGQVTQTVHISSRSPWPFTHAQRLYVAQRADLGRLYGGSSADNYGQAPFGKQHCPAVARIMRKNSAALPSAVNMGGGST